MRSNATRCLIRTKKCAADLVHRSKVVRDYVALGIKVNACAKLLRDFLQVATRIACFKCVNDAVRADADTEMFLEELDLMRIFKIWLPRGDHTSFGGRMATEPN